MKKKVILLLILSLIQLIPFVKAHSWTFSDTFYLDPGGIICYTGFGGSRTLEAGDIVYWSFRTFDNPFKVYFGFGCDMVSNGSTTDEGVLTVTSYIIGCVESIGVCSENVDSSNSGSIEITLNVNPETDTIAGYNIIFIIVIFGISIIVIQKVKNRHRTT